MDFRIHGVFSHVLPARYVFACCSSTPFDPFLLTILNTGLSIHLYLILLFSLWPPGLPCTTFSPCASFYCAISFTRFWLVSMSSPHPEGTSRVEFYFFFLSSYFSTSPWSDVATPPAHCTPRVTSPPALVLSFFPRSSISWDVLPMRQ